MSISSHTETPAPHSIMEFGRVDFSCGSFDALSAVHFSQRFPPHFHETFAIGVVETGVARLHTPRGEWTGRAGTILAFSPGEVHSAEPVSGDGYTYRMIYPTADVMRALGFDFRAQTGFPLFRTPVIMDPRLARELHEAHRRMMDGSSAKSEEPMIRALSRLVTEYGGGLPGMSSVREEDAGVVARAQEFMTQHIEQAIRLAALADHCGLNPFQLIRVFRRVVGVPPYAYLVQLRVNRAQTLLYEGISVARVAYCCGFSDQSHLTRIFKKALGVPPGQYMRSVRQRAS